MIPKKLHRETCHDAAFCVQCVFVVCALSRSLLRTRVGKRESSGTNQFLSSFGDADSASGFAGLATLKVIEFAGVGARFGCGRLDAREDVRFLKSPNGGAPSLRFQQDVVPRVWVGVPTRFAAGREDVDARLSFVAGVFHQRPGSGVRTECHLGVGVG